MTTHIGHKGTVKYGPTPTAVGEVTNFDVRESAPPAENSALGDEWDKVSKGTLSMQGTINGHYDPADAGQVALGAGSFVDLKLYPIGDSTGEQEISGNFYVSEFAITNSERGQNVGFAATVQSNGAVTKTTVP